MRSRKDIFYDYNIFEVTAIYPDFYIITNTSTMAALISVEYKLIDFLQKSTKVQLWG